MTKDSRNYRMDQQISATLKMINFNVLQHKIQVILHSSTEVFDTIDF